MAHYAFLDSDNIVTQVITGVEEGTDGVDWEAHYGDFVGQTCKRTSFNTREGVHLNGGTPFRKNYAGVGMVYDSTRDAFYTQQPFDSWILNEDTCIWEAPVERPDDGNEYNWNEEDQSWDLV